MRLSGLALRFSADRIRLVDAFSIEPRIVQIPIRSVRSLPRLASTRSVLLHPLTIATLVWGTLLVFYALHFSALLRFTTLDLLSVIFAIWTPFALVAFCFWLLRPKLLRRRYRVPRLSSTRLRLMETRLRLLWRVWLCAAIFETFVSGGVPLVWLFTNPSKTYFDYGLPSLHGLVNSLLFALTLCHFLLYLLTGEKRHLRIPAFCIAWCVLLVTRGSLFFIGLECVILLARIRPVRIKLLGRFAASLVCIVLLFGWAGDLRTGAETFRELAQPTDSYPRWLPSGMLWVYIYVTTPLNNLEFSLRSRKPDRNPLLPHTLSILLPSVLRNYVYGDASAAADVLTSELVESNFNVSTAYSGPAQDFGLPGIVVFGLLAASACHRFWYKSDLRSQLIFAMLAQCLVLSLFYNLFLSLPIIAQAGWFYVVFRKPRQQVSRCKPRSLLFSDIVVGIPSVTAPRLKQIIQSSSHNRSTLMACAQISVESYPRERGKETAWKPE